jgi:hypothetical protein
LVSFDSGTVPPESAQPISSQVPVAVFAGTVTAVLAELDDPAFRLKPTGRDPIATPTGVMPLRMRLNETEKFEFARSSPLLRTVLASV